MILQTLGRYMKTYFVFVVLLGLVNLFFTDCSSALAKQGSRGSPTRIKDDPASDIVIAVIDTGIDLRHPDLQPYLWTNPGESGVDGLGRDKSINGQDDDHNGYVDDVHGWNFIANSNDVSDHDGHGSHVSGVILQTLESFVGSQKMHRIKIMPLKYYDEDFPKHDPLAASLEAMSYVIKMNASILNYSGGGFERSVAESALVEQMARQEIPLVAAAGNEHLNTDLINYFPAAYKMKNIISVAASDENGDLASFSNFGAKTVDIAAPGSNVISTLPSGKHGRMSGTSQSTAYVTGIVAGLLLQNREMTASQLKEILLASAQPRRWLFEKMRSQGIVQMDRSLKMRGRSLSTAAAPINQPNLYLTKEGFRLSPNQDGTEFFQKVSPE